MAKSNQTGLDYFGSFKGKGNAGNDQLGDLLGDPSASMSARGGGHFRDFFKFDYSTTGTGLDQIPDLVAADPGLKANISSKDIAAGARAADGMNHMIYDALNATGVAADGEITEDDVAALNAYIRADEGRLALWTRLHGDDENGAETGFHRVQNDGATTQYFGENLVNTVADGIYHLGFEIQNGRLLNEDGDENATLSDVADWLNYFYVDQSTTGTGLDKIVDTIKADRGLAENTNAGDINEGAAAANSLNQIIADVIGDTQVMSDKWITEADVRALNAAIQGNDELRERWAELHGDDEGDEETGFHLVQNDGGTKQIFGKDYIDTVADGIYHLGFAIEGDNFLNEDGNANASVEDMAKWLNHFMLNTKLVNGTDGANRIVGGIGNEQVEAGGGNDTVMTGAGDDLIYGGAGNDKLNGGIGNDFMYGGDGADTFVFGPASGRDIVADFEDGVDKLNLRGSGVSQFSSLNIAQVGDDTVVGFNGNEVVLAGINAENITQADFVI